MKKITLLLIAIGCFGYNVFAQLPEYVPASGLVGWWPFSGNADDIGLNSYNGVVTGATTTNDRFGKSNSAYSFDGKDDAIEIAATNLGSSDFTISIWFKTSFDLAETTFQQILMAGYNQVSKNKVIELSISSNSTDNTKNSLKGSIRHTFPLDNVLQGPDSINDGEWKHAVIVKTNTSLVLYLNNVLVDSISHTASSVMDNNIFRIGNGQGNVANRWFKGSIDDIGVWNRTLSKTEIAALYSFANTGLQDDLGKGSFNVWPNPSNGHITINNINVTAAQKLKVKIYNGIGQEVFASDLNSDKFNADLTDIGEKGIYFLIVSDDQNTSVYQQKFLLK